MTTQMRHCRCCGAEDARETQWRMIDKATMDEGATMDIAKWVTACVHHTGDDAYWLQIELGNDHAITLTCRKDEPPSVALWRGNGEHSFVRTEIDPGESINSFRQWVADAFEP